MVWRLEGVPRAEGSRAGPSARLFAAVGSESLDRPENMDVWTTLHTLCPFVDDEGLLRRQLLEAAERPEFRAIEITRPEILSAMSESERSQEKIRGRKNLESRAQQLISTRLALASALRSVSLPSTLPTWLKPPLPRRDDAGSSAWRDEWVSSELHVESVRAKFGFDLSGTFLVGADLGRATFLGSNCDSAMWSAASLDEAWFAASSLWKADLRDVRMRKAAFPRANLSDGRLVSANLAEASFQATSDKRRQRRFLWRGSPECRLRRSGLQHRRSQLRANLRGERAANGRDVAERSSRGSIFRLRSP
jgi:hypothetical protein